MEYTPDYFKDAPVGQTVASECSPQIADDFVGVVIAVPERVVLQGDAPVVLPICGAFQVTAAGALEAEPMQVHLRRDADGAVLTGAVMPDASDGDEPEEPMPEDAFQPSPEALANTLVSGHFHIDAQRHLDTLLVPGRYEVIVTFAGDQSETMRVEILP